MPAIEVRNLGKCYALRPAGHNTLRDEIAHFFSRSTSRAPARASHFWALREVSFTVEPGEVVGIIGRNGAGKSTLLKLLTRITAPTEGEAAVCGRVSSLLEVGTGFHPELTGRENIYLNGAILGMRRAEIRQKFDEIVGFAEVESFVDTPVKRYSSGMYTRLAFSVAAHLEPEILVVDEVLAVGDLPFQRRCLAKMREVSRDGRTVLFVSHNLASLGDLCRTGLVLEGGRMVHRGSIDSSIAAYLGTIERSEVVRFQLAGKTAEIAGVQVESQALTEGDIVVHLDFVAQSPLSPPVGGIILSSPTGVPIYGTNARLHPAGFVPVKAARGRVSVILRQPPLCSGTYRLSVWLGDWQGDYDSRLDVMTLEFHSLTDPPNRIAPEVTGYLNFPGEWSVTPAPEP